MTLLIPRRGAIAEQEEAVEPPASGLSLRQEIMADSPLGYWRNHNGQATGGQIPDQSGHNWHLTQYLSVVDAPSLIHSSPSDLAWAIDPGENFWNPEHYAAFDLTDKVSLSFWMRSATLGDGSFIKDLVRKGPIYGTEIDPAGYLRGRVRLSTGIEYVTPQTPGCLLAINTTYHIGYSFDSQTTEQKLYVNGVLVSSALTGAALFPIYIQNGYSFVCGAFSDGSHAYGGQLDEVALYDHVLSSERMLAHYQAGSGPLLGYTGEVLDDSPLAYWAMTVAGTSMPDVKGGPPLVLFGGAVGGAAGANAELGNAVHFDGVNDYGRVSALDLSHTLACTTEYWLLWDVYDNNDSLALEFGETNQIGGFAHDPDSNAVCWSAFMGPNPFYEEQTSRPSVSNWHHIAVIARRDVALGSDQFVFYFDGIEVAGSGVSGGTIKGGNFANAPLMVMARSLVGDGTKTLYGTGAMQHLAVYDRALSAARVAAHYAAGL